MAERPKKPLIRHKRFNLNTQKANASNGFIQTLCSFFPLRRHHNTHSPDFSQRDYTQSLPFPVFSLRGKTGKGRLKKNQISNNYFPKILTNFVAL